MPRPLLPSLLELVSAPLVDDELLEEVEDDRVTVAKTVEPSEAIEVTTVWLGGAVGEFWVGVPPVDFVSVLVAVALVPVPVPVPVEEVPVPEVLDEVPVPVDDVPVVVPDEEVVPVAEGGKSGHFPWESDG